MLDLILLRHPETQWNKDKLLQGHSDIPALNSTVPDALVQAVLKLGHVSAVYTSDLMRCRDPALDLYRKISAQASDPVLYCETPLLRERNFGAFEGKHYQETGCDSVASIGSYLYSLDSIETGESKTAARERARNTLKFLVGYQQHDHGQDPNEQGGQEMHAVVVGMTHGCFMNYLLTELEGRNELLPYSPTGNLSGFKVQINWSTHCGIDIFPK